MGGWGCGGDISLQFTKYSLGQVSPGNVRVWAHEKISHLYDALTSSGSFPAYDLPIFTTHLGAGRAPCPSALTYEKTEAQEGKVTCPRLHSGVVTFTWPHDSQLGFILASLTGGQFDGWCIARTTKDNTWVSLVLGRLPGWSQSGVRLSRRERTDWFARVWLIIISALGLTPKGHWLTRISHCWPHCPLQNASHKNAFFLTTPLRWVKCSYEVPHLLLWCMCGGVEWGEYEEFNSVGVVRGEWAEDSGGADFWVVGISCHAPPTLLFSHPASCQPVLCCPRHWMHSFLCSEKGLNASFSFNTVCASLPEPH